MKIDNIKRNILVIVISFFAFIGTAFADSLNLEYNGSPYTLDKNYYIGLTCKAESTLNALTLTSDSNYYYIKYDKRPSSDGTDVITCEWSGKNVVGHTKAAGKVRYEFSYQIYTSNAINVVINGSIHSVTAPIDLISQMKNYLHISENITINKVERNDDGSEYLNWSACKVPGSSCLVSITDAAVGKHDTLRTDAEVTYTVSGSSEQQKVTVYFIISVSGGAKAWTGDGTCNFNGSQWQFTDYQGWKYYETKVTGNATLPMCTPNAVSHTGDIDQTNGLIKFKGWVKVPNSEIKKYNYQRIGTCATLGALAGGSTISATDGGNYVACYENETGIQLGATTAGTTINDVSSCTKTSNGVYFCSGTGTRKLPTVSFNGVFAELNSFGGWLRNSDKQVLQAGTEVPYDGESYTAIVNRTVVEKDYYKVIYVGQKDFLAVDSMKSCSVAANEYLSAEFKNGDCFIVGLKETNKNDYIDVNVGIESDGTTRTITYKFEVKPRGNNSEAGDDGRFVIDVDSRIVAGETNMSSLNDFEHPMCDTVTISSAGESTRITATLSSNNYKATTKGFCDSDPRTKNKEYLALCMDPGRAGPGDSGNTYHLTQDIQRESDFGKLVAKLISYINDYNKLCPGSSSCSIEKDFREAQNPVRIASHVAVRAIVLVDGYSGVLEQADTAYYSHYVEYNNLATELKEIYDKYEDRNGMIPESDLNAVEARVTTAVETFGLTKDTAKKYLIEILTNYKNFAANESSSFERTIDSKDYEVIRSGAGYEINLKGTFSLPTDTKLTAPTTGKNINYKYMEKGGAVGTLVSLVKNNSLSTSSPKRDVYDYEIKITVNNASSLVVPQNSQQELDYSLRLSYEGGIDFSSVRIANPEAANAASKQRMIVFDLSNSDVYIYFDVEIPTAGCQDIPALDYTKCESEENCDSSFNKDLFKASGCCRYVLNETKYDYIMKNLCNGECTVSTMSNVCSYDPNYTGSTDLYTIKEGAYYSGASDDYDDAIGTCIVNVSGKYADDFATGKVGGNRDTYSKYGTSTGNSESELYQKYDDNGNSIMVASYRNNQYCQLSCREEWTFTMGAFGNFVGENSVLAGNYFQNAENDIFIEGKRTCYTTYIDYDYFMNDLVELSKDLVPKYNEYSNWSHAYSDIERQKTDVGYGTNNDALTFEYDKDACVQYKSEAVWGQRTEDVYDPAIGRTRPMLVDYIDYYKWECSKKNDASDARYGVFTLKLDNKFVDSDAGTGKYNKYEVTESNFVDHTYDEVVERIATEAILKSDPTHPNPTKPQYSQSQHSTNACTFGSRPRYNPTEADIIVNVSPTNCYQARDREDAFNNLAAEMQSESRTELDKAFKIMSSDVNEIINKYEQMWQCQHFELYNSTDDANNKTNNSTHYGILMGNERAFNQISTAFDPYVSYTYDESAYMTILQDDNILIQHTGLNDKFFEAAGFAEGFDASTNVQVDATVGFTDRCELSGTCEATPDIDVKLSRNKLEFTYYKSGPWDSNSTKEEIKNAARKYDDGAGIVTDNPNDSKVPTDSKRITLCTIGEKYAEVKDNQIRLINDGERTSEWKGGKCYTYTVSYINAHYIKASITNSSFYRNKGIWYLGPNDTREHGETLEDAWDNASKRQGGPSYTDRSDEAKRKWSVFVGTKDASDVIQGNLNLFPVSMTTPRNLYQYTYEFTQIGSYSDGKLSRIMGDASSLISLNARTCFYEVVEDICLCCGDPIVTYSNTTVPSAEDFVDSSDYNYEFSEDIEKSKNGVLGFNTTTVSLGDLNTSTDRALGGNWTGKASFYYSNNKLETNKGEVALKEIQGQGEEVYAGAAEYSFTLKPSALAAIRDYNDKYGYEVNYDNLKVYGRASIQPMGGCSSSDVVNNCKWFARTSVEEEEMNNYIANFSHYGSKFLENMQETLNLNYNPAGDSNLTKLTGDNAVCAILRSNDTDSLASTLRSKFGSCRWVDYIERADNVKTLWDLNGSTQYYRLAFK